MLGELLFRFAAILLLLAVGIIVIFGVVTGVSIFYATPTVVMPDVVAIQPYEHVYRIVLKEKHVIYNGARVRCLLRYYNQNDKKHYILEDNQAFIDFDVGESLNLWEKHDGQRYYMRITRELTAETRPTQQD